MQPNPQIDALFAEWDRPDSPGCALGVVEDDRLVYARGYGMANLDYDIAMEPGSVFHVASVSKQFAAMAVALLAREGTLSLDTDIREYLPELPDFGGQTITPRHLILHTSGLRDQWSILELAGWRMSDLFTNADVLDAVVRQRELNFPPGEEHLYSNTGYTLLGIIVERVTGKTLRQFTEERFFGPLGMTRTHFHDDHMEVVKGRATAYEPGEDGGFRISIPAYDTVGATSLFTTVEDLARWIGNLSQGTIGGRELIAEATTPGALNSGERLDYAYGLQIGEYRGARVVEHSGGDAGYRAHLMWLPEMRFGVAVLCNYSAMWPNELCRRVADLWLADRLAPKATAELPIELEPEQLEQRAGLYYDPVKHGSVRLEVRDGVLTLGGGAGLPLTPLAVDRYIALAGVVDLKFDDSAGDEPLLSLLIGSGKPAEMRRVHPVSPLPEELEAYAGRYIAEELETVFRIVKQEEGLVLRRRKHDDAPLQPVVDDVFVTGDSMTLLFDRNDSGEIAGFRLTAGRVRNVRFSKASGQ